MEDNNGRHVQAGVCQQTVCCPCKGPHLTMSSTLPPMTASSCGTRGGAAPAQTTNTHVNMHACGVLKELDRAKQCHYLVKSHGACSGQQYAYYACAPSPGGSQRVGVPTVCWPDRQPGPAPCRDNQCAQQAQPPTWPCCTCPLRPLILQLVSEASVAVVQLPTAPSQLRVPG